MTKEEIKKLAKEVDKELEEVKIKRIISNIRIPNSEYDISVKAHMRELYAKVYKELKKIDLVKASKEGNLGKAIRRKKIAEDYLKEIEEHGSRITRLSEEDMESIKAYGKENFIKLFWKSITN